MGNLTTRLTKGTMSKTYRKCGIDEVSIEGQFQKPRKKNLWYIKRRKSRKEKKKIKELDLDGPVFI